MNSLKLILIVILILLLPGLGLTEEAKEDKQEVKKKEVRKLEKVIVTGEREEDVVEAPAAAKVPAVVDSTTKAELEKITVLTTDDTLRYKPGMYVRKLYPGGSVPLSIRGTHPFVPRTVVLTDGIRLSDYTSSGSVKWSQVAPEEIERIDVIYGPYSAMYSGFALGGAALITTRFPEKREIVAKTSYMYQNFKEYKTDYDLDGYTAHVSYGDKFGKFRVFALVDRMENEAQPISFNAKLAEDGEAPTGDPVTGYSTDQDYQDRKRFIIGDRGIRDITDTLSKIRLGYDIDNHTQVSIQWGHWWDDQDTENVGTYLRNSAGNKVYSGSVDIDGLNYNISPSTFSYSERRGEGDIYAIAFKREPEDGLKLWTNASFHDNWKNLSKQSTEAPPDSKKGGAGKVTDAETGWYTFDFKGSYRPSELPILASHTLTMGYHFDHYFTDGETWNASDWKKEVKTTLNDGSEGKTRTHAIFLQDECDITDKFILYLGGRYEWWRGFDGSKSKDVSGSRFTETLKDKKEEHFSPKLAVTYRPDEDWSFRLSLAKAYRFPTIRELYYASISSTGIVTKTNPDLKAEKIFAKDLTISRRFGQGGDARLSFFENYTEDTIFRQTDVYKNISYYQNVDEVRTRGIEFSVGKKEFLVDGLDVMFNIAYMEAKILKNDNFPASDGKTFPRAPKWTSKGIVSYSPTENLILTLAGRYSSKPWNTLDNTDHRGGYGGIDDYLFIDTKISYKLFNQLTLSLAVDNLTDELAYMYHPYARRMFIAALKWEY